MNKQRRKTIQDLINQLEAIHSELTELLDQEQGYLDNMPEGLQAGAKGDAAQEAIDNIQAAADATESAGESIQEALDALWNACA